MKTTAFRITIAVGLLRLHLGAFAAYTVEENKAAFFAAHPTGLVTETFEAASIGPNATQSFNGPLNASTNNAVFSSGSILAGIELRTLERVSYNDYDTSPLIALGAGVANWSSKALSVNDPVVGSDKLSIVFAYPQTVLGFDLSSVDLRSNTFRSANFLITFYSDPVLSSSEVASASINAETSAGAFVGLSSDLPVRKIVIASNTAFATPIFDNLAFSPVPEPSSFVLSMLVASALYLVRRRRRSV